MRHLSLTVFALLLTLTGVRSSEAEVLRSVGAVTACAASHSCTNVQFSLTARVTYVRRLDSIGAIGIEDESGAVAITVEGLARTALSLRPGDTASFTGRITPFSHGRNRIDLESHAFVRHGPAPRPVETGISDLLDGKLDYRLARIQGLLRDAVTSETHPDWIILVLCEKRDTIYVSVPKTPAVRNLDHLIGRHVSATGLCLPTDMSPRDWIGPTFKVASPDDILPTDNPAEDAIPDISEIGFAGPASILSLGRHHALGRILAVWNGSAAILRTTSGDTIGLEFATGALPAVGQSIKAVGLPESDLYRINLSNVRWSPVTDLKITDDPPITATPDSILPQMSDNPLANSVFFGKAVTLTGEVIELPAGAPDVRLLIRSGGRICTIDAGSCPGTLKALSVGCLVRVTGVCVLTSAKANRLARYPRLDSLLIVTRSEDDLVLVSRPSWWTPSRLFLVLVLLLALLTAVLIWNTSLRRAVARESEALLKEQSAKLEETFKIDERTRLAAELHDYLAQNLTVVSYQLSAAQSAFGRKPDDSAVYLANADRMLRSCRVDLRRCLWDLRNDTLNEPDFARAIAKAVTPVTKTAALHVRFDIRRSKISDSTAHAILSICRELAANATLHGKAQTIRIVGESHDGAISFSVRDDGCGFDPTSRLGQSSGHFGLDGIIERVKRLGGTIKIESETGRGTRIAITLPSGNTK